MFFVVAVASYFLGGIPFGYLVAKAKGVDILQVGSKSIGATNVGRTLGKKAYFTVLLLDVLKGAAPSFVASLVLKPEFGFSAHELGLICGLIAVIGHIFSPFLKFKGGKGIATGLGVLVGGAPIVAGIVLVVWGLVFFATRYVSLASLMAVVAMVVSGFIFYSSSLIFMSIFIGMGVFIVFKHRSNVGRLLKGDEPKFSFKKNSDEKLAEEGDSD